MVSVPAGYAERLVLAGDRTRVLISGSVYCRGGNAGALAMGSDWVRLPFGTQVGRLHCGDAHCCAETFDGRLYCMGAGSQGRLGIGDASDANFLPRLVSDVTPIDDSSEEGSMTF